MKKLLRRRIRLWVLMSATFALISMLTVVAIVLTFDRRMASSYRTELSHQLTDGLSRLEWGYFSTSVLKRLEDQGVRSLVFDRKTGEVRFRSGGRMPLTSAEIEALDSQVSSPLVAEEEYALLCQLLDSRLGDENGSFQITDSEMAKRPGDDDLESKELFLCGRNSSLVFCLNLPMETTNTAVKLATRFTRIIGIIVWFVCVIVFYFLSKLICRPHRSIAETAAQIANLDFSKRCPEGFTRELDDLRLSINSMADSLEGHVNALRETNAQLQAELSERIRQQKISAELIANLAHDLKTPITIISGYAEGLSEGVARTPEKQQTYFDTIQRESKQMQTIVTRILALGRMESGETPIIPVDFDLTAMLDEILDSFQRELERLDLRLTRVGPKPCLVYTDYDCIRQSLINYVQNAVYHISNGNRIEVRLEDLGDRIRVRVINSSEPIAEEEARRFWEKLYRGDPSRQRQNGEMGLGLSIVKGNMERLGHAYGFENVPEFPGVCFWLEVPKAAEEEGQCQQPMDEPVAAHA